MNNSNTRLLFIMLTALTLLIMPSVAMQFSNEVNWSLSDFVIAGIMLFGTGLAIELVLRKVKPVKNRLAICGVIIIVFMLVWVEMAVGIFGSPIAGS